MWDVVWTDHDRESVGQHRARKREAQERKSRASASSRSTTSSSNRPFSVDSPKGKGPDHGSSSSGGGGGGGGGTTRSRTSQMTQQSGLSISARSPVASAKSVFSRLSGRSAKAAPTATSTTPATLGAVGHVNGPADGPANEPATLMAALPQPQPAPVPSPTPTPVMRAAELESRQTTPTSARDSIFSRSTEPASGFGGSFQESTPPVSYTHSPSSPGPTARELSDQQVAGLTAEMHISSPRREERLMLHRIDPGPPPSMPLPETPPRMLPQLGSPILRAPPLVSSSRLSDPDAWTPLSARHRIVASPAPPSMHPAFGGGGNDVFDSIRLSASTPDSLRRLEELQQTVRKMATTPPLEILRRLDEIWKLRNSVATTRAQHIALEAEHSHWMMSILEHLDTVVENNPFNPPADRMTATKTGRILALYETKARTSYLACSHYRRDIFHLSVVPLSRNTFPNVHPLSVPTISPSAFPAAVQAFDTIYSLALPALCSASVIPAMLRNVHRALAPGGTFRLTIIDPMPHPSSLGPALRAWLDDHLIINLERRFRCVTPSKLFPGWLADAHLRANGSTITQARFNAMTPRSADDEEEDDDDDNYAIRLNSGDSDYDQGRDNPAAQDRNAKLTLRTVAGRMLWSAVWGEFLDTKTMWWDEPDCVDECLLLDTFWNYSMIEGIRDDEVHVT